MSTFLMIVGLVLTIATFLALLWGLFMIWRGVVRLIGRLIYFTIQPRSNRR